MANDSTLGMSLTAERATLLPALAAVLGVVEGKATVPVLTHFLLTAEGDTLTVTGANYDAQIIARIPAEVERPGQATVAAQALHDIVRKTRAGAQVAVKADPVKQTTTVSSARSRFVLPGFPVVDFPDFNAHQKDGSHEFFPPIELAGSILAHMIARSSFAISNEETRYYLNGVYCHCVTVDGEPTLRFVATNGHILARIDTTRASGLDTSIPGVILPRKAVDLTKKLAAEADTATVSIELSTRLVRVTAGGITLVSKLIDGTFPNYAAVIPSEFKRECVAPTAGLIDAVERVATVAQGKLRSIKLAISEGILAISLRDPEGGEASDEVEIELEGEPLTIGFSAKYLSEILGQTGGDTVRLKLGVDGMQPVVIGDKLAEGLFVLMPLRIPA